jgi:hypothetical protein
MQSFEVFYEKVEHKNSHNIPQTIQGFRKFVSYLLVQNSLKNRQSQPKYRLQDNMRDGSR